ncbi:hypothetical protein [Paremcibacter congregatus]|uniref:hypothetical protein n=1 Tax=Paremcibacter congregatus TaxID=2043170 RepID=UPI0030ECB7DB|tara:strand:- start:5776 stop:6024 length:249 start_codon:yes stop_codon:yes gene_type:complete
MIKNNLWHPETKCNCWIWANVMLFLAGGKVVKEKSEHWPGGFHILWESPSGDVYSYSPHDQSSIGSKQTVREWIFEGYVKRH